MVVFSDFGFSLEWFTRRLYRLDFIKEIKKKAKHLLHFGVPTVGRPVFPKLILSASHMTGVNAAAPGIALVCVPRLEI